MKLKFKWNPIVESIDIRKNGKQERNKVYDIGILQFSIPIKEKKNDGA